MARKYNWQAVKVHYSYEYKEAGKVLNCSVSTIMNWVREGLTIYADRKPHVIDGKDLREFARAKNDNLKWPKPDSNAPWNYFACFRCKGFRLPYLLMVDGHRRQANAIDLIGICEDCETTIRKTVSRDQLTKIETTLDVTIR